MKIRATVVLVAVIGFLLGRFVPCASPASDTAGGSVIDNPAVANRDDHEQISAERFWSRCRSASLTQAKRDEIAAWLKRNIEIADRAREALLEGNLFVHQHETIDWLQFQSVAADLGPAICRQKLACFQQGMYRAIDLRTAVPMSLGATELTIQGEPSVVLTGPAVDDERLFFYFMRSSDRLLYSALRDLATMAHSQSFARSSSRRGD